MLTLPDYPWDTLTPYRERAAAHPDGVADLSIGTPVDPTPELIRRALTEAADAHGYPTTHGTADLRRAVVDWYARRRGVAGLDPEAVVPTVGSKEFIAWLPTLMGLGAGDVVVHPEAAYPTYAMGALIAGAEAVAADDLASLAPEVRERKLAIPDHLSPFQVLGENDQALAALEDAVPDTDVHVRGHQVTLRGTDDALRRGEHIMRSLIELASTGQPVTAEAVQRAANLFGDDRASGRKLEEVL